MGRLALYRTYRPNDLADVVGQQHITDTLEKALAGGRMSHAYLLTGPRGVGKTSVARILARRINELPADIDLSSELDLIEIDAASNRGIDEIRSLREKISTLPSRLKYKVFIIDEVHMLTREAFNALLKTLEEPPGHVKFIFCTTDPNKIPITILSRCQRFDFAGIQTGSIATRLAQIVEAEHVEADAEALDMLARRAAGSMRDGQSLLEQLLAFAPGRITLADVHGMLGTAAQSRLDELAGSLADHDASRALAAFEAAIGQGVDPGLLLEQLFGYYRDCMAATVGCRPEAFLYVSPASSPEVDRVSRQMGIHAILAAMQILDQALSRLRQSTQGRILAELALVRIAMLDELDDLASLVTELRQGGGGSTAPSPSSRGAGSPQTPAAGGNAVSGRGRSPGPPRAAADCPPDGVSPTTGPVAARPLTEQNAAQLWAEAADRCEGLVADYARRVERVAISAPNRLVVIFKPEYTLQKSICERSENAQRLRGALAELTGEAVEVEFRLDDKPAAEKAAGSPSQAATSRQRSAEIASHPLVRRADELFGVEVTQVAEPARKPK